MKWKTNGVEFRRGCHECLIAQFDGTGPWWELGAIGTQQTMKSEFKRLGEYFGANQCEVKPEYDDNDDQTESDIVSFLFNYHNGLFIYDEITQKYFRYQGE